MRNIFFSISLISCVFSSSSLVYDPYSATDESPVDVNLDTYLDYVSDSMIRKQEVRDRLQELQKPADEFHIDGTTGTGTKTTYDSVGTPTTTPLGFFESGYDYWNMSTATFNNNAISSQNMVNSGDFTSAAKTSAIVGLQSLLQDQYINLHLSYMETRLSSMYSNDLIMHSESMNESFKQTNALNEIKAQIQTGNVLAAANLGVGDTINSNLNSINNRLAASNLYSHEQNSKLDTTNGLLTDIKDTLNSGGEFGGFDTNGVNPESDSILDGMFSFFDDFGGKFTTIVNDATSIKNEFDDLKTTISGSDLPTSINITSSSTACDISFNLLGGTQQPLNRLPVILSRYSAVFSLFIYVSVMLLNFKFLFRYFSLGVK